MTLERETCDKDWIFCSFSSMDASSCRRHITTMDIVDLIDPRQPELYQHHSLGLATPLDFYESHVSQHTSCNPCNIVCFMLRILEVSGFSGTQKNIDIMILPSKCGNITRHVLCRYCCLDMWIGLLQNHHR